MPSLPLLHGCGWRIPKFWPEWPLPGSLAAIGASTVAAYFRSPSPLDYEFATHPPQIFCKPLRTPHFLSLADFPVPIRIDPNLSGIRVTNLSGFVDRPTLTARNPDA
jgi:hypothetical protein